MTPGRKSLRFTKIISRQILTKVDKGEDDNDAIQAAAGSTGRRRSSVAQSKEFTKLVKDLQEDYSKKGFDEKLKEETLANLNAKKPMKAAKKGTLKEKKDAMASLLNTVVERTEGMNDAWEHFASADPAFANVASYRFFTSCKLFDCVHYTFSQEHR